METKKSKGTYNKAQRDRRLERQTLSQVWFDREDMDVVRKAAQSKGMPLASFIREAAIKSAKSRLQRAA